MHFNCAEVVIKDMLIISDCVKVELYFRYTLNIQHLKTDIIQSDIKTHFRLNINKCALCTGNSLIIISISVSFELSLSKYVNIWTIFSMKYMYFKYMSFLLGVSWFMDDYIDFMFRFKTFLKL